MILADHPIAQFQPSGGSAALLRETLGDLEYARAIGAELLEMPELPDPLLTQAQESADSIAMTDLQQGIPTATADPAQADALDRLVRDHLDSVPTSAGTAESIASVDATNARGHNNDALQAEIAALLQASAPVAATPARVLEQSQAAPASAAEPASPNRSPDAGLDPADPEAAFAAADQVLQDELAALLQSDGEQAEPAKDNYSATAGTDTAAPADGTFAAAGAEPVAGPGGTTFATLASQNTNTQAANDAVLHEELAALLAPQTTAEEPAAAPAPAVSEVLVGADAAGEAQTIASFEETIGDVEEIPAGAAGDAALPAAAAPVYDTFPARTAESTSAAAAGPAPRRKSRVGKLCNDVLLMLAQLLDMPFSRIPTEIKQYAGITGIVSATLGMAILLVLRFSHH